MKLRTWSVELVGLYWLVNLVLGWSAVVVVRILANAFRRSDPTLSLWLGLLAGTLFVAAIVPPLLVTLRWQERTKAGSQS